MLIKTARCILILGACSAIGRQTALSFARQGNALYLTGRDSGELEKIAQDIRIRFQTTVFWEVFNIERVKSHRLFFKRILKKAGRLNGVFFAIGTMAGSVSAILNINFNHAVSILNICAEYMERQPSGFIIALSSVAGDRGRQSNYLYGAAKGALSIYLEGLRHKLFKKCPHKIRVITIKLGFVDTPMTFGLPGLFLVAAPEKIGRDIVKTLTKTGKDVFYLPGFWKYLMLIIKNMPDFIFKRLSL